MKRSWAGQMIKCTFLESLDVKQCMCYVRGSLGGRKPEGNHRMRDISPHLKPRRLNSNRYKGYFVSRRQARTWEQTNNCRNQTEMRLYELHEGVEEMIRDCLREFTIFKFMFIAIVVIS